MVSKEKPVDHKDKVNSDKTVVKKAEVKPTVEKKGPKSEKISYAPKAHENVT